MPREMVANAFEAVHDHSLPAIAYIQDSFSEQSNFMTWISTFFDPRYVFLIYAPILFAFSRHVSQKLVITLTLAEWSNQVLKWFLAGERPYWYVHERSLLQQQSLLGNSTAAAVAAAAGVEQQVLGEQNTNSIADSSYASSLAQELRQFPVTCELGAGSPSGHAMVTASVWYILIDSLLKGQLAPRLPNISISKSYYEAIRAAPSTGPGGNGMVKQRRISTVAQQWIANHPIQAVCWTVYAIMLLSVSVSRVFLACHFPHQCLAGALMGLAIAKLVSEANLDRVTRRHYQWGTVFMFASVMATFATLRWSGFNPLWSVDKAMKWCAKPEYIHLDTTPFFSMMRYLGFCLGAGLGLHSSLVAKHQLLERASQNKYSHSIPWFVLASRLIAGFLSIQWGAFLLAVPVDKSILELFYVISFIIYVLFAYAAMAPIPYYTQLALTRCLRPASVDAGKCKTC